MADVIRPKNVLRERVADSNRKHRFRGKKFKDLTQAEKDQLLKAIAIRLGILSGDQD